MGWRKIIRHAVIAVVSFLILIGSLFIPRSVDFPSRRVKLGYPVYFYSLDFSSQSTSMGGAPESYLKSRKFDFMSGWEEPGEVFWSNLALSYLIIFLVLEGANFILHNKLE